VDYLSWLGMPLSFDTPRTVRTAETDHRPADAVLIRPDAHIAWAETIDEPTDTMAFALREALSCWLDRPMRLRCRGLRWPQFEAKSERVIELRTFSRRHPTDAAQKPLCSNGSDVLGLRH
jgi:hypothetical protein